MSQGDRVCLCELVPEIHAVFISISSTELIPMLHQAFSGTEIGREGLLGQLVSVWIRYHQKKFHAHGIRVPYIRVPVGAPFFSRHTGHESIP